LLVASGAKVVVKNLNVKNKERYKDDLLNMPKSCEISHKHFKR
jgi:hypothetical protein